MGSDLLSTTDTWHGVSSDVETVPENTESSILFLHHLSIFSWFPLMKARKLCGRVSVQYVSISLGGWKLIRFLQWIGCLRGAPLKIQNLFLLGHPQTKALEIYFQAWKKSHEARSRIIGIIEALLPEQPMRVRSIIATNIEKFVQLNLAELIFLCNLAELQLTETKVPPKRVLVASSFVPLFDELGLNPPANDQITLIPQPPKNKSLQFSLGGLVLALCNGLRSLKNHLKGQSTTEPIVSREARVGLAATWGLGSKDQKRLDDLFWWRDSEIDPGRLRYLFEGSHFCPTAEWLSRAGHLGMTSVSLDRRHVRQFPNLVLKDPIPRSLCSLIKDLAQGWKLSIHSLGGEGMSRLVASLTALQLIKASELRLVYRALGLRGVFHHQEVGLDLVSLASELADAARIGTHWSCFDGLSGAALKSHEAFFFWGPHDAEIAVKSGTHSNHLLIAGCVMNDYSHQRAREEAKQAVESMKRGGVQYVLALFDSSTPAVDFHGFFLEWLIKDSQLGLLIKSKKKKGLWKDGLGSLSKRALQTDRIHELERLASPADAAAASDFSVGCGTLSAVAVSALQGARVFYLDYEHSERVSGKEHAILHSLGPDRCVFYDLESLRYAILKYIANPSALSHLGDASPILDRLDPFRDHKAGLRIGEYVRWYLEGLDRGMERHAALTAATRKYAETWGRDKVLRGL